MAPKRVTKKTSSASASSSDAPIPAFPRPPALVPTKSATPNRTPTKSPSRRRLALTQAQKQALIDNLQLEVTERARRLRAQYALQAQGLRTRLEIRIHRIPAALRKAKLGDLLEKHSEEKPTARVAAAISPKRQRPLLATQSSQPSPERRLYMAHAPPTSTTKQKRKSEHLEYADKENAAVEGASKRAKTGAANQSAQSGRTASRKVPASQILSPKSNNSRTLPQSPFKVPASPAKSNIARPASPLKALPAAVAAPTASTLAKTANKPRSNATVASRAPSRQAAASTATVRGRRAQNADNETSRTSDASNITTTSAVTTIVKSKKAAVASKATARSITGKITSAASKARPAASTAATAGRPAATATTKTRTLRKRT